MIEVPITQEMFDVAKSRADFLGARPTSFMHGDGNLVGYLGKEIVFKNYGVKKTTGDGFNYDFEHGGKKYLIKTKETRVRPDMSYMCSISDTHIYLNADYYVFCRVNPNDNRGWICGYISKQKFLMNAAFLRKGDRDGKNGYIVKNDNYSLPISELLRPELMLKEQVDTQSKWW